MTITKPYKRVARQFTTGGYGDNGAYEMYRDPRFAADGPHYVRAFQVLYSDFSRLVEYIEPADVNHPCYSFRTYELLLRICTEIETNFKAIFEDNGFEVESPNLTDYWKIEKSHMLSDYLVKIPVWKGEASVRKPFADWTTTHSLKWYRAYNDAKHSRHAKFQEANFENVCDAFAGLAALLYSQFTNEDFSATDNVVLGPTDGFESFHGDLLQVKPPLDTPNDLRYEFQCSDIESEESPFQNFDYKNPDDSP